MRLRGWLKYCSKGEDPRVGYSVHGAQCARFVHQILISNLLTLNLGNFLVFYLLPQVVSELCNHLGVHPGVSASSTRTPQVISRNRSRHDGSGHHRLELVAHGGSLGDFVDTCRDRQHEQLGECRDRQREQLDA